MKDKTYKINEIFYSIQGEGHHVGTPAYFIRFAGCNYKCSFCDTEHEPFTEMTTWEILKEIEKIGVDCGTVILTGGEPLLQIDEDFIREIYAIPLVSQFHLETNGTIKISPDVKKWLTWVTVSPKGKIEQYECDELKILVTKSMTEQSILHLSKCFGDKAKHRFLQPEWDSKKALDTCFSIMKEFCLFRLSTQMHKRLDIR